MTSLPPPPSSALSQSFDAVVMLTWSDWHTEPRSNRYHYATRFARSLSVYFVQPDGVGSEVAYEPVEGTNITIVHIAPDYGEPQARRLRTSLAERGIQRPLLWIYNVFFEAFVASAPRALAVFHATEDYVTPAEALRITPNDLSDNVRALLSHVDMIAAVSEGVANGYRTHAKFNSQILLLPNGCDFEFWEATEARSFIASPDAGKVALFQGGINARLDYDLLLALVDRMPNWQFWFCGKSVDGGPEWAKLQAKANVRYFGLLPSSGIADLARQALIGLIPFEQDGMMRRSLPLKAYEYLACGLPVVSIPIDALQGQDELFATATNAEEFAAAIERVAPSRTEPDKIARRSGAARSMSYDLRFGELEVALTRQLQRRQALRQRLNVLMLYDDRSTHVGTIREHLEAFQRYSRHNFHFVPATGFILGLDDAEKAPDLNCYDAILTHYSVRLSIKDHISAKMAAALTAYWGPKLLFIQDEYDTTEVARRWIEQLGIDAVFTNVPADGLEIVYPRQRFPRVDFIPTLTGYVPEDPALDDFLVPIAERTTLIAYRGRRLPHQYGALGQDKFEIGVEVKRLADERGLAVDIEVDDSRRIYGLDWYRFLGSARATLGTESGSNVFDFDGELSALAAKNKDMPFELFAQLHLGPHEGIVRMNQISPKIFEAVRLRTALVLFEGDYSGVVKPDIHYIPLKRDYSNITQVFSRLADIDYLTALTDRAYRDIIESQRYSYETFVRDIDGYLDSRALGRRRATVFSLPAMASYSASDLTPLGGALFASGLVSDAILGGPVSRERVMTCATQNSTRQHASKFRALLLDIAAAVSPAHWSDAESSSRRLRVPASMLRVGRGLWRLVPLAIRVRIKSAVQQRTRAD